MAVQRRRTVCLHQPGWIQSREVKVTVGPGRKEGRREGRKEGGKEGRKEGIPGASAKI